MQRSGRTTRMIQQGIEMALKGKNICFLFESTVQIEQAREVVITSVGRSKLVFTSPKSFKLVSKPVELFFCMPKDGVTDWTNLTTSIRPQHTLLIDHAVIEKYFSRLFTMQHAFDKIV